MTLQHKIELIKNTFKRHTFGNTKDEILRSLDQFEDEVSPYCHGFFLCAVINWHKNIFLQKAGYFARAEEILDECLSLIENLQDSLSSHWKLKIYLSLGYVHRARWNYSDAQAYLNRALEISLAEEYLAKFRGEIYSLLSKVNLDLDRYTQAQKYVNLEKDEASRNYQSNPSNRDMGIIYAYSLINFSYINRHIGLVDREIQELLMQSVRIFTAIGYRKGVLKARLEFVIYEFMLDKSAKVLETAEALEMECRQLKMNKEIIRTGILLARVYKHQGDSLRAKIKLRELIDFSRERHFQHSKMTADAFYDLGLILYETNHEEEAFEAFTESTKIGMIIGLKDIIVRSSNAIGVINRNNPEKKLISDLLYQNTLFIKDRFQRNTNPLTTPGKSERFFCDHHVRRYCGLQSSDADLERGFHRPHDR